MLFTIKERKRIRTVLLVRVSLWSSLMFYAKCDPFASIYFPLLEIHAVIKWSGCKRCKWGDILRDTRDTCCGWRGGSVLCVTSASCSHTVWCLGFFACIECSWQSVSGSLSVCLSMLLVSWGGLLHQLHIHFNVIRTPIFGSHTHIHSYTCFETVIYVKQPFRVHHSSSWFSCRFLSPFPHHHTLTADWHSFRCFAHPGECICEWMNECSRCETRDAMTQTERHLPQHSHVCC